MADDVEVQTGRATIDRRSFLRRLEAGAVVTGAAWALPSIASGNVAFAAGSTPTSSTVNPTTTTTPPPPVFSGSMTFSPGATQIFTIPANTALEYVAVGGAGGTVPPRTNTGGRGGAVSGTIPASPTTYILEICAGSQGQAGGSGGGGGASSLISGGANPTPTVLIIAGGGGGGGGTGVSGGHGVSYASGSWVGAGQAGGGDGGAGGNGGVGGAGGAGVGGVRNGGSGNGGSGGPGGNGGSGGTGSGVGIGGTGGFYGGGGGGGYGGGGGGSTYGGGGGGGSVATGLLNPTGVFDTASGLGDGQVQLTAI